MYLKHLATSIYFLLLTFFVMEAVYSQETAIVFDNHEERLFSQIENELNTYPETFEQSAFYNRLYKENGPFNIVQKDDELLDKRTLYSKTFYASDEFGRRVENQLTTIITAGKMHYVEDGLFKTITEDIIKNSDKSNYELIAPNNAFKTYYGKANEMSVKTRLDSDAEISFLNNTAFRFLDDTYLPVSENHSFKINGYEQTDFQTIEYKDIYESQISAWIKQQMTGFKSAYIIHSKAFFNDFPEQSEYIAFSEEIILPTAKWSVKQEFDHNTNELLFYNEQNEIVGKYETPYVYEEKNFSNGINVEYRISQEREIVTLEIVVPVAWLISENRSYPVVIDPTWHAGTWANWTGTVYRDDDGDKGCTYDDQIRLGFEDVTYPFSNKWYSGWATFQTNNIDMSCGISSVYVRAYRYSASGGNIRYRTGTFNNQSLHPTHRGCSQRYDYIDYPTNPSYYNNTPPSGWSNYGVSQSDVVSRLGDTYTCAFWTEHTWDPSGGTGDDSKSAYFRGRTSSYRPQLVIDTYGVPNAGTMSVSNSTICSGGTTSFQASGTSYFEQLQYQWNSTSGSWTNWGGTNPRSWSSSSVGDRLYVRSKSSNGTCTDYSSPVSCLIVPDPSPPTATKSPNVSTVCEGQSLTLTGVTDNGGGTGSCNIQYRYSTNGGSSYSGWSTTNPSFSATGSDNRIQIRKTCNGSGCDDSGVNTYIWSVVPDPATPTATKSPNVGAVCAGQSLTLIGVTDHGGGTGSCNIQYRYSTNGGSSYSGWSTTNPSFSAIGSDNRIQIRKTCGGNGCDDSGVNTYFWTVVPDPIVGIPNYTNSTICSGGSTVASATVSGGTGVLSYHWQYYNGSSWSNVSNGTPSGADYSGETTTDLTISGTNATGVHQYRLRAYNSLGCSTNGVGASYEVVSDPSISISEGATICSGGNATLNASAGGGVNGQAYQWEVSTNGISGWSNVGSDNDSYNTGALTATRYYRCHYFSNGDDCSDATSNTLTVAVETPPVPAGLDAGDYFWAGEISNSWNNANNWLLYDGSNYAVPASIPDATSDVFIKSYASTCGTTNALTDASSTVHAKDVNIETELTIGNSAQLNISGDFNNNGTFNAGTGSIVLNGTSQQNIQPGGDDFYNLTINNTSGLFDAIILDDNIHIAGHLQLSQGIIDGTTTPYKVKLLNGATANSGNANSFVNGEVERTGTTAFVYPIGDVANIDGTDRGIWAPIETDACALSTISANYYYENPPYDWWYHGGNMDISIDHVTDREYWDLVTDNATPAVTIYWTDNTDDLHSFGATSGEMTSTFVADNLTIAHYNTALGKWDDMGASIPAGPIYFDDGSIKTTMAFSNYSPITFASKNSEFTLPVELTEFYIQCDNNRPNVYWNTASEINNEYFILEGSSDGSNWQEVAKISGAGNSYIPQTYSVIDEYNAFMYYKLIQYDFDGHHEVLGIRKSDCYGLSNMEVLCYPNPFRTDLHILINNPNEEKYTIKILDVFSQVIWVEEIEITQVNAHKQMHLSHLRPGMYFLHVQGNQYEKYFKLEKLH